MAHAQQRQPPRSLHGAQVPRGQAARATRASRTAPPRTAPCPWCRQPLPPACCATCLNREARHTHRVDINTAAEAMQRALAISISQWSRRPALRERHAVLVDRLADLRATTERRTAAVRMRRRQLEERRDELRERRRRHEARAAEWATAWQRLEAKRCRISRDEFLRDPAQHSQSLGAFHVYQELSVVRLALQAERRRRCADLIAILPLKWIVSGDFGGDRTVTLAQVQSFTATGVLKDDELKDLEAALSMLLPLISVLAAYLDVTLPFPCTGAQGHGRDRFDPTGVSGGVPTEGLTASSPRTAANVAWWTRPSVLHPFTGRWHQFSIYDNICTAEFSSALRLIDEDLRRLCVCQGEAAPDHPDTLQLLATCLSAARLGCVSPPTAAPNYPPLATASTAVGSTSASQVETSSATASDMWIARDSAESLRQTRSPIPGRSRVESADSVLFPKVRYSSPRQRAGTEDYISLYEDGEWTVVEHEVGT